MLTSYQVWWSIYRDPITLRTTVRADKRVLRFAKFETSAKKKVKKIFSDIDLYPTDFRKKNITGERGLINFFMKGGKLAKSRAILRTVYSTLYNLLLFKQPVFLRKQYKFFETLGQIILHDNTWYCFNNLLTYYLQKIKPLFYIQSISTAQTFKKKKKALRIKPYRLFLKKLPIYKRFNFAVRELSLYIKFQKRLLFSDKIFVGLMDLFMHDKKAFLFKKKIKCYKQALSKYITDKSLH